MIYCLAAKLLLSFLGVGISLVLRDQVSVYISAFLIGILPIWGEVLASAVSKVEPARASKKSWLLADAVVDILVFLIIPAGWFYFQFLSEASVALSSSLFLFILCGRLRIIKFLRKGLSSDGYFEGLPVTYTGYVWIVLCYLMSIQQPLVVEGILVLLSLLMILNKKFIKASR